jgi:serine phosphatase RsbU (regulator of sigma subunit)
MMAAPLHIRGRDVRSWRSPLVYSDGLTETLRAGSDEFFGDAELERVLRALTPGDNMLDRVLDARERWSGGAALPDDISVVAVDRH